MAYKNVGQLKDSISGILTGINLNSVVNLNLSLERTARELTTRIYIPSVQKKSQITLYDTVYDYTAPTDIFGSSLVDFRPQGVSRLWSDFVIKKPIEVFDRTKAYLSTGYNLAFEYINGTGRVRIVSRKPNPKVELDSLTATTGWTATGSASSLTKDATVFWHEPAALRINLSGSSTGTLTKDISSQDLTDYKGVGVVFLAFRTPSSSSLTSIAVRIGSDATNYYEVTVTTGFIQSFTANEWMFASFDLSTASTVGSPTITAIDYAQIRVAHTATINNFYVGDLFIALPSPHDMLYQTSAFFLASGGTPSQTITANTDQVILSDNALVIYEYECANTIAQQQGGTLASGLLQQIEEKLWGDNKKLGLYQLYRGANPSEELRMVGNYYDD